MMIQIQLKLLLLEGLTKRKLVVHIIIMSMIIVIDFNYLSLTVMLIFLHSFATDSMGPLPLMEGEGRSLKVLGFTQNQRAAFVQILMRFILIVSLLLCLVSSFNLICLVPICWIISFAESITGLGLVILIGKNLLPAWNRRVMKKSWSINLTFSIYLLRIIF